MSVSGVRDVGKEACAVNHLERNLQQFQCARLLGIWTHPLTASLSSTVLTICVADIWRTCAWDCKLLRHSLTQLFIHARSLSTCKRNPSRRNHWSSDIKLRAKRSRPRYDYPGLPNFRVHTPRVRFPCATSMFDFNFADSCYKLYVVPVVADSHSDSDTLTHDIYCVVIKRNYK